MMGLDVLAALVAVASGASATVLSMGDGDTVRVSSAGRDITVRLACIDAPELRQAPHGANARQQLQSLLPVGSRVALRARTTD